ncbi:MAG: hypothetical protein PVS3B1_02610 [Ktedonobacteraceae bacterium]
MNRPVTKPNMRLEAARLERRWSVEVASSKVGVSVNTFNRWERGLQVPQLETLDLLCRAFEMRPEELGLEHVISTKRRAPRVSPDRASIQSKDITETPNPAGLNTESPSSVQKPLQAGIETCTYTNCARGNTGNINETKYEQGMQASVQTDISGITDVQDRRGAQGVQDTRVIQGDEKEISRRRAMAFLISTPATIFQLAPRGRATLLHPEEVLALSKVNIPLCWKLYFEGGFTELEQVLPGYLAQLAALAQNPSRYSQQAAELASQTHQLAYLLALQRQNFGIALKHTRDAGHYGRQAEDINLQVTAIVRQAYIYFCLRRSTQRLSLYEEAMRRSKECSPLIQGYVYAGLAEAYASRQEKDTALDLLYRARHTFPEQPEEDPHFSYTHFRPLTLYTLEGLVNLHLVQAKPAWDSFAQVDRAVTQAIVPHRVELTVYQAATALQLGELEQSCDLLHTATTAAVNLGSHLRYQEASHVYDQLQARWPREQRVKELQDLFQ